MYESSIVGWLGLVAVAVVGLTVGHFFDRRMTRDRLEAKKNLLRKIERRDRG